MNHFHPPAVIDPHALGTLERRAARLVCVIEAVGQRSEDRHTKEACTLITERIQEMFEEMRDMHEMGDIEVRDRMESMALRLRLAERKIKDWPLPKSVRRILTGRKSPSARAA
ncbi:MAG: hypothetical protein ACFB9M_20905 [Myxococcota bacterium]